MRYILMFWALPMGFFWGWYFLSLNDLSFGFQFFSRRMHDIVFHIYGSILGIDPAAIPAMVARACVFDTFLIFGILAFRRRAAIRSWLAEFRKPAHLIEAPREIA
jgi:Family of unknown function (DUF6105)